MRLRTEAGGTRLVVTDKAAPRLLIDTGSFSVSGVAPAADGGTDGGSPFAWLLALALFSAAIPRARAAPHARRRPGRTPPEVATGTSD